MAEDPKIDTFFLPEDMVLASAGFALDIGGSMAKIVFRSNKDYKDGKFIGEKDPKCPEGNGPLHSIQFPRGETDRYCDFLKENCDIIQDGTIYGTGVGGSQFKARIESLGIKLEMLTEFECFIRSLNTLLKRFVKEDWLHPINEKGLAEGLQYLKLMRLMQDMTAGRALMTEEEFQTDCVDHIDAYVKRCEEERKHLAGIEYPYLMVMCGSAFALVKVNKDGSAELIDLQMISGRFFLGMGATLSGEKDYAKLVKMCEDYDGASIDVKGKDILSTSAEEQEDLYTKIPSEARVFPFGKGHDIDPGSAKIGDLVSSLNQSMCENLALSVFHVCMAHGLRQAYFCGGFVSQEIVRRYITKGIACRCLLVPSEKRCHIDFVANSSHLGSLGAYVFAAEL